MPTTPGEKEVSIHISRPSTVPKIVFFCPGLKPPEDFLLFFFHHIFYEPTSFSLVELRLTAIKVPFPFNQSQKSYGFSVQFQSKAWGKNEAQNSFSPHALAWHDWALLLEGELCLTATWYQNEDVTISMSVSNAQFR